jgi:hypothetical protein
MSNLLNIVYVNSLTLVKLVNNVLLSKGEAKSETPAARQPLKTTTCEKAKPHTFIKANKARNYSSWLLKLKLQTKFKQMLLD